MLCYVHFIMIIKSNQTDSKPLRGWDPVLATFVSPAPRTNRLTGMIPQCLLNWPLRQWNGIKLMLALVCKADLYLAYLMPQDPNHITVTIPRTHKMISSVEVKIYQLYFSKSCMSINPKKVLYRFYFSCYRGWMLALQPRSLTLNDESAPRYTSIWLEERHNPWWVFLVTVLQKMHRSVRGLWSNSLQDPQLKYEDELSSAKIYQASDLCAHPPFSDEVLIDRVQSSNGRGEAGELGGDRSQRLCLGIWTLFWKQSHFIGWDQPHLSSTFVNSPQMFWQHFYLRHHSCSFSNATLSSVFGQLPIFFPSAFASDTRFLIHW